MQFEKNYIKNLIIKLKLILVSSFIFFWETKIFNIDLRIFIFFILLINFFEIIRNNKNYFSYKFFIFPFLLLIQLIINIYIYNDGINIRSIRSIFIIFLLTFIIFYNYKDIINNFRFVIKFFLISFLISLLIYFSFIKMKYNFFDCSYHQSFFGDHRFIFKENSHLGMVAVPIFFYYIFNSFKSLLEILCFVFFVLICALNYSSILHFLLFILSLSFLIFTWKYIDYLRKIIFLSLILLSTIFFFISRNCNDKITNTYEGLILGNKISNLSTAVFLNSLDISKNTLIHRPLGWGIEKYEEAYFYYNFEKKINLERHRFLFSWKLNTLDASNNFSKMITEFGLFSFIFFWVIFYYLYFVKYISLKDKAFFLTLIFTQLIRGAGYFNGGFIFAFIVILYQAFYLNKKNA